MRKILFLSITVLVLLGLVAFWYRDIRLGSLGFESQSLATTSAAAIADNKSELPEYTGQAIDYIGKDPFIKQVPDEYLMQYKNELTDLKKSLTQNPDNIDGWLRVGSLKKFFNNYLGARDAWEYAKIVNSVNSTPYYNLGGLYAGYLDDNVKAEKNYLAAVERDPMLAYVYLAAADFYSVFYQAKKDQAREVILRGLEVLPDNESLLQALTIYPKTN